ncbi:thioredoxin domain-containing protein [Anaeramoeba flamelloides]|uniref:Thioredoxin domain-containing protein n=1 Tax=Anaeramoeba flamelloides TaxID=1746091 RepID=A0AAV7ZE85_9EUKA|nr:thioredoxin domain-containing protein [Anaeramoeba flamelloides]
MDRVFSKIMVNRKTRSEENFLEQQFKLFETHPNISQVSNLNDLTGSILVEQHPISVLRFHSKYCYFSWKTSKTMRQLSEKHAGDPSILIADIEMHENPKLRKQFGVGNYPEFVIVSNLFGFTRVVYKHHDRINIERLERSINEIKRPFFGEIKDYKELQLARDQECKFLVLYYHPKLKKKPPNKAIPKIIRNLSIKLKANLRTGYLKNEAILFQLFEDNPQLDLEYDKSESLLLFFKRSHHQFSVLTSVEEYSKRDLGKWINQQTEPLVERLSSQNIYQSFYNDSINFVVFYDGDHLQHEYLIEKQLIKLKENENFTQRNQFNLIMADRQLFGELENRFAIHKQKDGPTFGLIDMNLEQFFAPREFITNPSSDSQTIVERINQLQEMALNYARDPHSFFEKYTHPSFFDFTDYKNKYLRMNKFLLVLFWNHACIYCSDVRASFDYLKSNNMELSSAVMINSFDIDSVLLEKSVSDSIGYIPKVLLFYKINNQEKVVEYFGETDVCSIVQFVKYHQTMKKKIQ